MSLNEDPQALLVMHCCNIHTPGAEGTIWLNGSFLDDEISQLVIYYRMIVYFTVPNFLAISELDDRPLPGNHTWIC